VQAKPRDTRGKNEARRTRSSGLAPAVVYGGRGGAAPVSIDPKEVNRILHSKSGHNTIFNLELNGEVSPVMIVDWQDDPLKGSLLHVDLKRIDLSKRINVKVPVETSGDPRGVKQQGGLLELVTREIEIECLPDEIPESFVLDVSELMVGQSRRASEVALTGSMKLMSSPDAVIAHVIALRVEAEPAAEAAAAAPAPAAEPEVIKKGKKEEEVEEKGKKK
jgi:large subunit ribosomal protein L25